MNAQVKQNAQRIDEAIGTVIEKMKASKAAGTDNTAKKGDTIKAVRQLAAVAVEVGADPDKVAERARNMMVASELPEGTVRPYVGAVKGYALAIVDGKDVEHYNAPKGEGDAKPMTVRQAQTYPEDREKSKAELEREQEYRDVIAEINKRVKAVASLDKLKEIRDSIPAAPDTGSESPQERKMREAREALEREGAESLFGPVQPLRNAA